MSPSFSYHICLEISKMDYWRFTVKFQVSETCDEVFFVFSSLSLEKAKAKEKGVRVRVRVRLKKRRPKKKDEGPLDRRQYNHTQRTDKPKLMLLGTKEVGRRFFVWPRATWRARDPKPKHWRVSVMNRWAGETQSITRSLASPPKNNKKYVTHND